jgi:hypothetical protein
MRSDSSPTCYCFNKQSSKDPAMARVVDLWEDIQHFFGFEALMIHCKGEWNEIADRASRWDDSVVQGGVEEAVREERLGEMTCTRITPKWSFGDETVDILDELTSLTAAAVAARKETTLTTPASHHPTPHRHPPIRTQKRRHKPADPSETTTHSSESDRGQTARTGADEQQRGDHPADQSPRQRQRRPPQSGNRL